IPTERFSERPPLDRVDAKDPARYTYFPQTGHNVPAPIMDYWNSHGSWTNIGLPLTELFRVVYDDGSSKLVQYFERQELELNLPAKDGVPTVTSSLIGYSAYAPPKSRAPVPAFDSNDTAI